MNAARKYSIAWKGLSEGEHTFDFEAGDDLFRLFENTEIKGGRHVSFASRFRSGAA